MHILFINFQGYTLFLVSLIYFHGVAYAANDEGAGDLGVDYAFLFLTTLSPDFSAANYTVTNESGIEIDVSIIRLPYHVDLIQNTKSHLQLELVAAYQTTKENFQFFSGPDESIDAEWDTYGAGLGLLYEYNISKQLRFTPSIRIGLAKMKNDTRFNGVLSKQIKKQVDGTLFNWKTNTSLLNLGLGLSYNWKVLDRASSIKANAYHIFVDSFDESNDVVKFTEDASMLSVNADMIFPTSLTMHDERLDFVLLLGTNSFFGENRNTLGYTSSYQAGIGAELPIHWGQSRYGHLRLSGQVLWAENMKGWLLSFNYNPD